jgi:hypothetical protein
LAKRDRRADLLALEAIIGRHPDGMTAEQIADQLAPAPPRRTLQHRLKALVDSKQLIREGEKRGSRYRLAPVTEAASTPVGMAEDEAVLPLSTAGQEIQIHLRRPPAARKPVGYDRAFLDSYRPNESFYLRASERAHLREVGTPKIAEQPAGTYAKQILNRLLIDLSWNSSRLEGNSYSLLDTKRLIGLGKMAEGKTRLEAQMILNHKEAIEFLVATADEITFNRHTILNLHALLANDLLPDPSAAGRLRHMAVGIHGSVFHPLETPQRIAERFDQLLETASAIVDPFEQAFFVMVQLPYLQPFDDVNKRVSRLAANIPLIKENLSPLSFTDVPRELYTQAILGVYEMNRTEMLRDIFIWAYERSALRLIAVRQSLSEPNPFRIKHRLSLREVVSSVILGRMGKRQATAHVSAFAREHIDAEDQARFREMAEDELLSLHEGNFARYKVRPSDFAAWHQIWVN